MSRRRIALRLLAAAYLLAVWMDGVGCGAPARVLPRTADYFVHVAALFPLASTASIDYRAEAYVCSRDTWTEIDTRPYFPIDPNDKENRFSRVMHFFRENRPTMRAVDSYIVDSHNTLDLGDGIPHDSAIGGVRLLSLRIPIPAPGVALERFTRQPLSTYAEDLRKVFYHTPRSKLSARCGRPVQGVD